VGNKHCRSTRRRKPGNLLEQSNIGRSAANHANKGEEGGHRPAHATEDAMSSTRAGLRWALAAGVFLLIAILTVPLMLLRQGDSRIEQAVSNLQVGMTDGEVQQTLKPITTTARIINNDGEVEYLFYGVDEFITVVLQPDGTTKRVVNVVHVPDQGSPPERYRRRLEDRMR
jgi:hypothetical protein